MSASQLVLPVSAQVAQPENAVQDAVQALLERLVDQGHEVGIQVAAWHDGVSIVSACAGTVSEGGREVDNGTIFPVFSVIKGYTSAALLLQADRGLVDLDAPIAQYWPEFAAHGKEGITPRHVLSHTAGVPQMPPNVELTWLADWNRMTSAIADLVPMHAPGAQSYYHGMTYGWLLGEIVRRTDPRHRSFAGFVHDELFESLGANQLYYSVPSALRGQVAVLSGRPYPPDLPEGIPLRVGIPKAVDLQPEIFNREDVQSWVVPAVGGYGNAASVVRLFAMLANGGVIEGRRVLSAERVAEASTPRPGSHAPDPFLGGVAYLSQGGYMLGGNKPAVGTAADTMFSMGAGGSLAWADRRHGLAVAITHNRLYHGPAPDADSAMLIGRTIRSTLGLAE